MNKIHHGNLVSTHNKKKIIDCKKCGFIHFVPLPSNDFLEQYYKKDFYQSTKKDYFKSFENDKKWYQLNYEIRYSIFEKFVKSKRKNILDVGSGPGLFLDVGNKRDWNTLGLEPSKIACEYSKKKYKLEIINDFVENINNHKIRNFDIIHLSFVLEHIANPEKVIKILKKCIKHNGYIAVEVPNDFNLLQEIYFKNKKNKYWISYPDHINYFNVKSLDKFLKKLGFKIVHTQTSFPLELFLLMNNDYTKNKRIGEKIHKMRKSFEFKFNDNKNLLVDLYKNFSQLNLGREVFILAKKI